MCNLRAAPKIARKITVIVDRLNAGRYAGFANIVSAERSVWREQEAMKGIDDAVGVLILADNRPGIVDPERGRVVQVVVGIDDRSLERAVGPELETFGGAAGRGVRAGRGNEARESFFTVFMARGMVPALAGGSKGL